jgi:transcriptional antiterminator RfaH
MASWYVIHTKPRQEAVAEANLRRQDFETYLPWFKRTCRRSGKWVDVIEPLFPRYLFARFDPYATSIAPIRSTFGVTKLVSFGNRLSPLPDEVVQVLRLREDSDTGLHTLERGLFEKGDEIVIASGPFEGLVGVYQATSGRERVSVLLDLLGRATSVILDPSEIVPGKKKYTSAALEYSSERA